MTAAVATTGELRLALVGVPNCGKTALFNRLTGSHQKVANYAGVTVERKEGRFAGASGRTYRILDLPGTYSMTPTSLDEAITRDAVLGRLAGEPPPEVIVCVVDATNLRLNLRLVLELRRVGVPMVVALNMSDVARARGFHLDAAALQREIGVPVIETVAVAAGGAHQLVEQLERSSVAAATRSAAGYRDPTPEEVLDTQREARRILGVIGYREPARQQVLERLDAIVMHPVLGIVVLAALLFGIFQAVFSWAAWPMELIDGGVSALGESLHTALPPGPLRSLLVDGVIAGAGSVLVFLPQIMILFLFILALEESGYLPRAAYLLDRVMGSVGLSGRAFIPLLSSFACAIPGIMATRTIPNLRDRMATIMIAPLMTCSARLPVYALLIGAFIPAREVGPFNLQGLVLFTLYVAGVVAALVVAVVLKRTTLKASYHPLLLELPEYHWPNPRNLAIGLWERARIFIRRVGTIILAMMVLLWFLGSYPAPPPGAPMPDIYYSFAGMIGRALEVVLAPIGFNWQISIALVPGLAAREVAVGALGTVYSLAATDEAVAATLTPMIAGTWSLATALSLLAWYVFAPQCLSTLVVVKRETAGWRYPLAMAAYLFGLAYLGAFVTYRVAIALGAG
jgi:ferrous iron transport protein B